MKNLILLLSLFAMVVGCSESEKIYNPNAHAQFAFKVNELDRMITEEHKRGSVSMQLKYDREVGITVSSAGQDLECKANWCTLDLYFFALQEHLASEFIARHELNEVDSWWDKTSKANIERYKTTIKSHGTYVDLLATTIFAAVLNADPSTDLKSTVTLLKSQLKELQEDRSTWIKKVN